MYEGFAFSSVICGWNRCFFLVFLSTRVQSGGRGYCFRILAALAFSGVVLHWCCDICGGSVALQVGRLSSTSSPIWWSGCVLQKGQVQWRCSTLFSFNDSHCKVALVVLCRSMSIASIMNGWSKLGVGVAMRRCGDVCFSRS